MAQIKKGHTKGLEKLEFLTDKTTRLVFQLRSEEGHLRDLERDVVKLRKKRNEIKEFNSILEEKLSNIENDNLEIGVKVEGLLEAINGLSPE